MTYISLGEPFKLTAPRLQSEVVLVLDMKVRVACPLIILSTSRGGGEARLMFSSVLSAFNTSSFKASAVLLKNLHVSQLECGHDGKGFLLIMSEGLFKPILPLRC